MAQLKIEILTPKKVEYRGEIVSATIPGSVGTFQILPDHAPIISTFEIGAIRLDLDKDVKKYFATGGGTVEVLNNNIRLLADSLEAVESIDVERANSALTRARQRLDDKGSGKTDVARAKAAAERAMNRIKLAEKYSSAGIK